MKEGRIGEWRNVMSEEGGKVKKKEQRRKKKKQCIIKSREGKVGKIRCTFILSLSIST